MQLENLKVELESELKDILEYWTSYSIDERFGGFYGRIGNDNIVDNDADRSLVLNARLLWTFSSASLFTKQERHLHIAARAYDYIVNFFFDQQYGGYYWAVDKHGMPTDTKKQVYGMAFCCYAYSEYYRASGNQESLARAKACFNFIEQHAFDQERSGYFEAFSREWTPVADMRLSAKDANEKKSANTHLHVLEAYTSLYRSWPDISLYNAIRRLLEDFSNYIVDKRSGHLQLFFDENWEVKGATISYGHDIEAAWLLVDAASVIKDEKLINTSRGLGLQLAEAACAGLDQDGGLWYESVNGQLHKQKHWWSQAEAMVGFFNAWQLSGEREYLDHCMRSWQFIKENIQDKENGEWFWGVGSNGEVMIGYDKAGFWKCPYHNSRACIEIAGRIKKILQRNDRKNMP